MFTGKKNVLQLVGLLKSHGIKKIVTSPGNRNLPIVHSLEQDPFFECYSIVDERSAAFFGIGLILKLRQPVAICCTSGTAVLNYASAVAEAYYQKIPLIVITADRERALLGQYEDQMVHQRNVFSNIVKKSVDLLEATTKQDEWLCNRLINEAILAANHRGSGPVHINIEITNKEVARFDIESLPAVRKISRHVEGAGNINWKKHLSSLSAFSKVVLVYGQSTEIGRAESNELIEFLKYSQAVIFTDNLSNLHHNNVVRNITGILTTLDSDAKEDLRPDLVITLHGMSLPEIRRYLRRHPPKEHWHIAENGEIVDQYQCLTEVFECTPEIFLKRMNATSTAAESSQKNSDYIAKWTDLDSRFPTPKVNYSNIYAIGRLLENIPKNSSLHLANSSCVRLAQYFNIDSSINVYSNRGTSGIDGCLSTAVGFSSQESQELTFIMIGDLTFFYDMNAVWNHHVGTGLRIFLLNNGGAGLFQYTIGKEKVPTLDVNIAAAHSTRAEAWVKSVGFTYLSARNEAELNDALPAFLDKDQNKPILFEVFTSMDTDTKELKLLNGKQSNNLKSQLVNVLRKSKRKLINSI